MMSDPFKRLARSYSTVAIVLLNTALGFVLLNGVFLAVSKGIEFVDKRQHPGLASPVCPFYGDSLSALYPGRSEAEIDGILDETWSRPVLYEPYVQFRERPFHGKYVNVDANGFRQTKNQGSWPPDPRNFNVFLFGGSTIFNYGVADDETVASFLQAELDGHADRPVRVYNFGRGSYYSTQERILFEKLILVGLRPDLAIFVDGLNDFYSNADEPYFNDWFQQLFNDRSVAKPAPLPLERLPLYQAARWVKRSVFATGAPPLTDKNQDRFNDPQLLDGVIARYRDNKKMIEVVADTYHVRLAFIWQPIPTYGWDLQHHLCPLIPLNRHGYARFGYERMAVLNANHSLGDDFGWCADVQQGLSKPLYVDDVHYSGEMSVTSGWVSRAANRLTALALTAMVAFALLAPWQIRLLDAFYSISFAVLIVAVVPIILRARRERSPHLWLFAVAWAAPILFAALRLLANLALVRWNFWLDNSTILSMAFEAIVSTLAIAYRIRLLSASSATRRWSARVIADAAGRYRSADRPAQPPRFPAPGDRAHCRTGAGPDRPRPFQTGQ